ncbi:DAK2 domain-containing protein, partial [Arthrobacter deserti]|nr:DAK2 domain-containing protein [Arthrobacter deserti]
GEEAEQEKAPAATGAARGLARTVLAGLRSAQAVLHENERALGEIDAVAGDGDHGRGMVKGIDAALAAAEAADAEGAGGAWLLARAGRAWAESAGGTSGVLWGAALEAAGASLTDSRDNYAAAEAVDAVTAFAAAITDLGRAAVGDKTLVDALLPFAEQLRSSVGSGTGLPEAWEAAARTATEAAAATAGLKPRLGRARPLAEKSLGTPDAGATSMALIVTALSPR